MKTQVFNKHPLEKRGSILLFLLFCIVSVTTSRTIVQPQSWGIVGFILFFTVIYAWYERVTLYPTHVEYKKLSFIIPKKKIIIAKYVQDIQTTTILPGLVRINVMTGNDTHMMMQYFERADELYTGLIAMIDVK